MSNSIFTILTYRTGSAWVFDDDRVGLVREPFVAGADTAIDRLAQGKNAVRLTFSVIKFPDSHLTLNKVKGGPSTGTDYVCSELDNHPMWLCPALNLYFPESPEVFYVKAVPEDHTPS